MPHVGDTLAEKYRLVGLLGEGGMGQVFEARHERIGKRVAVKTLLPAFAENAEAVERFTREAEAAAAVGHPGIIDIHDIGTAEDGSVFLVMEFLEGQSLGELLQKQGRLTDSAVAFVACQVLSTLQAAHDKGVVHRDLKPDNVFLVDKGQSVPEVKLLDFGISVMLDRGDPANRLTQTGTVMGTPYYMAPEQAVGRKDLDHRVDTYAMGVILYECLTGKPPFLADNILALAHQILHEQPPALTLQRPELSKELEQIVLRAMAKKEGARYQTATELLEELLPFVDDEAKGHLYLGKVQGGRSRPLSKPVPATVAVQTGGGGASSTGAAPGSPAQPGTDMAWQSHERPVTAKGGKTGLVAGIVAVVVLLVGGIGGGVLFLSRDGDDAQGATTPAPSPPTTPVASSNEGSSAAMGTVPAPTLVTLTLQGVPEAAQVLLDGVSVEGTTIQQLQSSESHQISVLHAGHEPWHVTATFERDVLVPVTLRPLPAAPDAAVEGARRPPASPVQSPRRPPRQTAPDRPVTPPLTPTRPASRFDRDFD